MDRLLLITTGHFEVPFGIAFQKLPMVVKGTDRKDRLGR